MRLTILELCDRLQELLADNEFDDVPVVLEGANGYIYLTEDDFRLGEVQDGDGYPAVIAKVG